MRKGFTLYFQRENIEQGKSKGKQTGKERERKGGKW